MPGYKLTPNTPDPITGLQNSLVGWHFISADALKVFSSFDILDDAGWDYSLLKDPDNSKLQRLSLTKQIGEGTTLVQHKVLDTQWYALDGGGGIQILPGDVVSANWTSEDWTPPAPQ